MTQGQQECIVQSDTCTSLNEVTNYLDGYSGFNERSLLMLSLVFRFRSSCYTNAVGA